MGLIEMEELYQRKEETIEAKLRNVLTPLYSLADMVLLLDEHPEIKDILIQTAKQSHANKQRIRELLEEIENKNTTQEKAINDFVKIHSIFNTIHDVSFEDVATMQNLMELIELRSNARKNKDWKLSDEIRKTLDDNLVFIFDTKEGQDVHFLSDSYFNKIYDYPERKNINEAGEEIITPAWSETQMQKIERLYSIKFETKRKFVEWNIQSDIQSEKRIEAWLYTMSQKVD